MELEQARWIRAGALEGYRDQLFLLGVDPDPVLKEAGIDAADLESHDTLIPLTHFVNALTLAAKASNTPAFSLLLSQRQSLDKLGAVAYMARQAPTLGAALGELRQFLRIHDSGVFIDRESDDGIAWITLRFSNAASFGGMQRVDLAMAFMLKFLRSMLGEGWRPLAMHFEHKKPSDLTYHQRIFRAPLCFDQPFNAIELPEEALWQPAKNSDETLFQILRSYVETRDREVGDDFIDQVRRVIYAGLQDGPPRLDDAAEALGLTRHVLRRRLKAMGTNFQDLQKAVRIELAQRYLLETDMSLIEISSTLSFSEPAVFTRTFQNATGLTPSKWRRQQHEAMPR